MQSSQMLKIESTIVDLCYHFGGVAASCDAATTSARLPDLSGKNGAGEHRNYYARIVCSIP